MNKNTIFTILAILLGIALYYLYILMAPFKDYYSWTRAKVNKSIDEGNRIIIAIEQYKNDNGALPDRLELLQPKYLSSIPKPYVPPYNWEYKINGSNFTLRVTLDYYPLCSYSSEQSEWYQDGIPW